MRAAAPGLAAAALLIAVTAPSLSAQIVASEAAVVEQTIDGTTITIEYSRPSLRGRDLHTDLLGNQIPWGGTWTPGANQATTIESNRDIRILGADVPAGRYSVWMYLEPDAWQLVLDPRAGLFHGAHPPLTDDQIHIPVTTKTLASSLETLAWSFPVVRNDGADLRMQWGDLAVDLPIEVESSMVLTLTAEQAAPYVGTYQVEQLAGPFGPAHEFELELVLVDQLLQGEIQFGADFSMQAAFVMAADQVFRLGYLMNGEVAEVDTYSFYEFTLGEDGRAVSFETRGADDELFQKATRIR